MPSQLLHLEITCGYGMRLGEIRSLFTLLLGIILCLSWQTDKQGAWKSSNSTIIGRNTIEKGSTRKIRRRPLFSTLNKNLGTKLQH
eukprot:Gb_13487 [translate_table: standard]